MAFLMPIGEVPNGDLMEVFENSYLSANLTFIWLIPKKICSLNIRDYKLIGLVTSVYKILSKLLAKRLGCVLGKHYCAFVEGRHILDTALIANEVVDDVRR